jgi:hypothetical protein
MGLSFTPRFALTEAFEPQILFTPPHAAELQEFCFGPSSVAPNLLAGSATS